MEEVDGAVDGVDDPLVGVGGGRGVLGVLFTQDGVVGEGFEDRFCNDLLAFDVELELDIVGGDEVGFVVACAFARGVGEYGSVIFIAGNLPGVSEIAPLLITIKLEEFDYEGATAIAAAMLLLSFALLLLINTLQARLQRTGKRAWG